MKELTFLKELMLNNFSVFSSKDFEFETYVCNGCHNLLITSTNLDDIAILNINGVDYSCIINEISKSEVVNSLQNAGLTERKKRNIIKYKFFNCIKNG